MPNMRYKTCPERSRRMQTTTGLTLVEMVIAVAIMAIVFAAIVPQFRAIFNSWDSKAGAAETLQNGRVLIDHLNRNLSKAVRITAVSDSDETNGYIEFQNNDGNTLRYDIAVNNYVEFGFIGSLYELAGPVSQLQFTCYDACDLDIPLDISTADVNDIRFVKVETTLTNPATMGQDKTFTTSAYLRVNAQSQACWQNQDIGDVGAAGSAGCADCNWTINGSGADIGGKDDEFHYVYQSLSGDGQIIARVVSVENTHNLAKAGVMIRETLDADSKHALMYVTANGSTAFLRRTSTGDNSTNTAGSSVTTPYWVKVIRSGDTFTGYESPNGSTWNEVESVTISMATDAYIGLAVTSRNDGDLCTAEIDNVSFATITYETFNEEKVSTDDTSITILTPDTNENDLLIAAVATDGDTSASLAPPAGEDWTEINIDDYSSAVTLGAWWKYAGASESSSHKFTWIGDEQAYGWMMRFTGHDSTDPINDYLANGESSSSPTSPAVTTTVDNCLILRLGAFDDDDITEDDPGLSGHTAITMDESASSAGAVTYQEFTEAKRDSDGTSVTILTPGGTSEGDLLITAVVTDGRTDTSLSPPGGQGWTLIDIGRRGNTVTMGVWWKLAGASEPASHQFTWGGDEQAYGWIMRFTGHDTSATINTSAAQGGNSSSPVCPSVTTTVANTMIVRIGGFDDDDITVDSPGLSGHTAITMDESSSVGDTCSGGAGYVQQASIGASGTSEFSLTATRQYRTVTVAITPAPTGGGTASGGAGYVRQSASGDSGTSAFSLGSSNEAQALTIAIAPAGDSCGCCGGQIRP